MTTVSKHVVGTGKKCSLPSVFFSTSSLPNKVHSYFIRKGLREAATFRETGLTNGIQHQKDRGLGLGYSRKIRRFGWGNRSHSARPRHPSGTLVKLKKALGGPNAPGKEIPHFPESQPEERREDRRVLESCGLREARGEVPAKLEALRREPGSRSSLWTLHQVGLRM